MTVAAQHLQTLHTHWRCALGRVVIGLSALLWISIPATASIVAPQRTNKRTRYWHGYLWLQMTILAGKPVKGLQLHVVPSHSLARKIKNECHGQHAVLTVAFNVHCCAVIISYELFTTKTWSSMFIVIVTSLPFSGQRMSCDAFLKVRREDNQNCSMLRTVPCSVVYDSCAQWYAHRCGQLVLWIGFYHAGFISLCTDLFVCSLFFVFYCIYVIILWARWDGPDVIEA